MAGEIVVEYTGELVRRPVADARECEYAAASGGMLPRGSCYMFAIDAVSLPHACMFTTCMPHAYSSLSFGKNACYTSAINAHKPPHALLQSLSRNFQTEPLLPINGQS